jgi:nicotinamidase-related amidase
LADTSRRALVVVDVQRGFVTPETEPTVTRLSAFLRSERSRYAVVIATRFANRPGSLYESERDWSGMMSGAEIELVPGLAEIADVVLIKHGLAPAREDLTFLLGAHGVQRADLCGFDTDQCVLATALLLWDAGIAPRVLAELCASSGGSDMHRAGLAITRRAIGDRNVTDTSGRPV